MKSRVHRRSPASGRSAPTDKRQALVDLVAENVDRLVSLDVITYVPDLTLVLPRLLLGYGR